MSTIAQQMFDGTHARARLEDQLDAVGVHCEDTGFDWYDCSLELHGVPDEYRLSPEAQKVIRDAGFVKVYVNHKNKWETHYTFAGDAPVEGWRVSYPHHRNDGDKSIWTERHVPGWPAEWFKTGYVVIKAAAELPVEGNPL